MNKLTKYGLTALAGSLVATSVSAGELGVSGSWSWSYDSGDSDESGNPMSMGDSVTFSGSGETDQGWTAGVSYELDGGNFDDYGGNFDDILGDLDDTLGDLDDTLGDIEKNRRVIIEINYD